MFLYKCVYVTYTINYKVSLDNHQPVLSQDTSSFKPFVVQFVLTRLHKRRPGETQIIHRSSPKTLCRKYSVKRLDSGSLSTNQPM